MSVAHPERFK